jgi:hypothetical protein
VTLEDIGCHLLQLVFILRKLLVCYLLKDWRAIAKKFSSSLWHFALFFAFNVRGEHSGKASVKRVASRIGKDDIEMFQEPLEEDPISLVSLGFH